MPEKLVDLHGIRAVALDPYGERIRGERDAVDLVGVALGYDADMLVIPAGRFHDDFFRLSTRVAGDVVLKFQMYRIRVAVVGDISRHVARSSALRDFVAETNRGDGFWFVATEEELDARLAARTASGPATVP